MNLSWAYLYVHQALKISDSKERLAAFTNTLSDLLTWTSEVGFLSADPSQDINTLVDSGGKDMHCLHEQIDRLFSFFYVICKWM
jgi:hypothetical protein